MNTVSRFFAAVSMAVVVVNALAEGSLTIAQGETKTISATQENTTVDVHGVLSVSGGTYMELVKLTATEGLTVGCAEGDDATVTVGDYGQIKTSPKQVTIGGPGGKGLVVLRGKRLWNYTSGCDANASHLFAGDVVMPAEATSETGVFDIIRLDAGGVLSQDKNTEKIRNESANCDARILFNGGYLAVNNGWNSQQRFVSTAGKALIFASENGHPINLRYRYGTAVSPCLGRIETAGAGDFAVYSEDAPDQFGWKLSKDDFVWGHKGDFRLSSYMYVNCQTADALPCLSDGGDIVLDGDNQSNWLDLNGKDQNVNGLVSAANSVVKNASVTAATLIFGSARPDGVLCAPNIQGKGEVNVRKIGAGTLTVTNTPSFANLDVINGTVKFVSSCDVTLSSVTVAAGARLILDGVQVMVGSVTRAEGSVVTTLNGGALVKISDVAEGEKIVMDGDESIASVTLKKTGEGTLSYVGNITPAAIHVQEGEFAVAGIGTSNEFWRVTIKETEVANNYLNLGPFRLFSETSNASYCDGGRDDTPGSQPGYTCVDSGTSPDQLAAKQVLFSSADYTYSKGEKHGSDQYFLPEEAMFNNATVLSCKYNFSPIATDATTWLVATYRIPALNGKYVRGYNVKSQWDGPKVHFPGKWKVESSPTGKDGTWEVVDEQTTSQVAPNGASWYRDQPYPLNIADAPSEGCMTAINLRVDAGALFDATHVVGGQEVSFLTIDVSKGSGIAKGVRLASTGIIDVVGVSSKTPDGELPLKLMNCVTGGDLSSWTVRINGVEMKRIHLTWRGDKLALRLDGLVVIHR